MTTDQVEQAASRGDIATGDFNAKLVLRRSVIPEFFSDVGRVAWRRRTVTFSTTADPSGQSHTMPNDFSEASAVFVSPDFEHPLKFIGDDPERTSIAETSPSIQRPMAYYITQNSTPPNDWKTIKFDAIPDSVYVVTVVYYSYAYFSDDTTNVNLLTILPEEWHWGLVSGLRKEIFFDRFGQEDPRYIGELDKYNKWVSKASVKRELGSRNHSVFVR